MVCFPTLSLAAGCKYGLKDQSRQSFYLFCCSLSAFDLRWGVFSRPYRLSDTFSYLLPDLQSLTTDTSIFLFMRTKRHPSTLSWRQRQCVVWLWAAKWLVFLHPWDTSGQIPDNTALIVTSLSDMYPEPLATVLRLTLTCSQGHAPLPFWDSMVLK